MLAVVRIIGALVVCAAIWLPNLASAQLPVCPAPALTEPYYSACNVGGRIATIRILSEFAVDQLFRTPTLPFVRRPFEVLRMFDAGWGIGDDHPLAGYLRQLNPIQFTRLDTATGNLRWDIAESNRSFTTTVEVQGRSYEVSWQLPAQIAGGYWRTPGVLQMALWEGQRPTIAVTSPDGFELRSEISCVALASESVRLVTTDTETPDVLIGFDPCP